MFTFLQVVQVCAEHKKPAKLLKHLEAIKAASQGLRNPPRVLVFANRIKVCAAATAWSRIQVTPVPVFGCLWFRLQAAGCCCDRPAYVSSALHAHQVG